MRVLILDDSHEIALMIGNILDTANICYDIANTYHQALEYMCIDYEWIICDFFLGGKDTGIDYANMYKKNHRNSKVLIYSARFEDMEKNIGGIDKIIYKSSRIDDLMQFFKDNIFPSNSNKLPLVPQDQYWIVELRKDVDYLKLRECQNSMLVQEQDKKLALFESKQKDFQDNLKTIAEKFNSVENKFDSTFADIFKRIDEIKTQFANDKVATISWISGIFFAMLCGFIAVMYELVKGLVK